MPYNKNLHAEAERFYDNEWGDKSFFGRVSREAVAELVKMRDEDLERRLKSKNINVRVLDSVHADLNRISKKESVSISYIINDCLVDFLKKYEKWENEEKEFKYNFLERFDEMSEEEQKEYLEEKRKIKSGELTLVLMDDKGKIE